jgi:hypothetical protein
VAWADSGSHVGDLGMGWQAHQATSGCPGFRVGPVESKNAGYRVQSSRCPVPDTKDTILSLRFVGDTERESSLAFQFEDFDDGKRWQTGFSRLRPGQSADKGIITT